LIGSYSNSLKIKSSYWDSITSGKGFATTYGSTKTNLSAVGLATNDFASSSKFLGFDFTNTWYISDKVSFDNVARPRLQWQKGPFLVSGNIVGLDDVDIILTDKTTGEQITKTFKGNSYSFSIKYNQSVIIKPVKQGCTFSPDSIVLNSVVADRPDQNFNVINNVLSNVVVSDDSSRCFDAENKITVAGNGTTVVFDSNSSVNLIAGQSIQLLPGFHAAEGSFVHAYITTDGSFCDAAVEGSPIVNQPVEKSVEEETLPDMQSVKAGDKSVKVFPNPNSGNFTVELINIENGAAISIFNMLGGKFFQTVVTNHSSIKIDLPEIKKGVYVIRVADSKKQISEKVIVN
jgi:hypothetical protein